MLQEESFIYFIHQTITCRAWHRTTLTWIKLKVEIREREIFWLVYFLEEVLC